MDTICFPSSLLFEVLVGEITDPGLHPGIQVCWEQNHNLGTHIITHPHFHFYRNHSQALQHVWYIDIANKSPFVLQALISDAVA